MQVLRQLTAIQRAIAVALLAAAFAVGFLLGDTGESPLPVPPNVPTGDFVVGAIASVVVAVLVVAGGRAVGRLMEGVKGRA